MNGSELHDRHLTYEEMVATVFPVHEGAVPVPLHLSVCAQCQVRVTRLREAWVLDKGAVEGVMEEIPASFWEEQAAAIVGRVRDEAAAPAGVASFPLRWTARVMRRPVVAAASLAAALVLVAGVTVLRPYLTPSTAPAMSGQAAESVLPGGLSNAADVRDDELLLGVDQALSDETPFRSLIPDEEV